MPTIFPHIIIIGGEHSTRSGVVYGKHILTLPITEDDMSQNVDGIIARHYEEHPELPGIPITRTIYMGYFMNDL